MNFANLSLGIAFSPLTAVQKVRVIGATTNDHQRITNGVQSYRAVPFARVPFAQWDAKVLENPEVKAAKIEANPFGRAVVNVTLRQPVARIVNSRVYIDDKGRAFRSNRTFGELPTVVPPAGAFTPTAAFLAPWEVATTAELCKNLAEQVPNVVWTVAVSDRGVISLKAGGGAEVELGSSEGLPRKLKKLSDVVKASPGILKRVRRLVLTYPDAPMFVR